MKYADVILPLPLENSYTYSIPSDLEQAVIPGCRVIVHFGKKRYYTAIVMDVHERGIDSQYETKEIYALLDATPVLLYRCLETDGFRIGKENRATECRTCCRLPDG